MIGCVKPFTIFSNLFRVSCYECFHFRFYVSHEVLEMIMTPCLSYDISQLAIQIHTPELTVHS